MTAGHPGRLFEAGLGTTENQWPCAPRTDYTLTSRAGKHAPKKVVPVPFFSSFSNYQPQEQVTLYTPIHKKAIGINRHSGIALGPFQVPVRAASPAPGRQTPAFPLRRSPDFWSRGQGFAGHPCDCRIVLHPSGGVKNTGKASPRTALLGSWNSGLPTKPSPGLKQIRAPPSFATLSLEAIAARARIALQNQKKYTIFTYGALDWSGAVRMPRRLQS